MHSARTASFAIITAASLLLLTAGCEEGVYGGAGCYDYDYYPGADVYFYPDENIYYWNDGRDWRWGRRLPDEYRLHEEEWEHLRLHSREPWTEHAPKHHEFDEHYRFQRR